MLTFVETRWFTRLIGHYRSDEEHAALQQQATIWMLTLYAKNEIERIPGSVLKKIKEELDGEG